MRVLVIRFGRFGDVVLTLPALALLKRRAPALEIVYLLKENYACIVSECPFVDKVLIFRQGMSLRQLRRRIAALAPDFIVDFHGNVRSHLLTAGQVRPVYRTDGEMVRRRLLVKGVTAKGAVPVWERHRETIMRLCRERGWGGFSVEEGEGGPVGFWGRRFVERSRRRVVLVPGAGHDTKRWPSVHYRALADGLGAAGLEVFVLGVKREAALVRAVASSAKVEGRIGLSFSETIDLLASARVVVGNDSGLTHLAEAVGTASIVLFGPTDPRLGFGPRLPGSRALGLDVSCRPCSLHGDKPCRFERRYCLEELLPSRVAQAVFSCVGEGL